MLHINQLSSTASEMVGLETKEFLQNVIRRYDDYVSLLKIPQSILNQVYKLSQNVSRIILVRVTHDQFVTNSLVRIFEQVRESKVDNFWVQVFSDPQIYTQVTSIRKIDSKKLEEIFAKTLALSLQVRTFVETNQVAFRVQTFPVLDTWFQCTYRALQSMASISYGQLLSAKLKSKLSAIALMFTLYKFGILDLSTSILQIRDIALKIARKYQLELFLEHIEKIFELFKNGIRDYSSAKLDKLLSSLFFQLDIVVKPPVILYYLSKFALQKEWFFTLTGQYSASWWYIDAGQVLELKLHGLLSEQKKTLKQLLKQVPLTT